MKRILIANDDGYQSPGLLALREALAPLGHIVIVAPASEKSACGHGMTLTRPLRFIKLDDDFYKLDDGTPTDCIYLSLHALYEEGFKPDLIVSGINIGSNMGEDVSYSGTASAAMEGVLHDIPSIAISQVLQDKNCFGFDFSLAKETIYNLAKKILENGFPLQKREFLNVNIPQISKEQCKGMKITELGIRLYGNDAHLHRNPRGEEYYWLGLHPLNWKERNQQESSDFNAIMNDYVSITPITLDFTARKSMQPLQDWITQ
ncbi:5'/3'-nucleotidase SurE [Helicobacter canadensis]|uniref:5'-nucleotidase SurE n=1 Tax=Helicobacter canadensis MIT 98-5491 TaxID=537970 RepID=C5ZXW2_9HELI|nr:5'/3'-nucleotidase SurE [Helicobacter canadensis]EES89980.1 5'-nucleotidase SurE [Helicobacter canadensis MIT 98-5491]EFR49127.1 5'/3'-nucleotidase SurE [Helicobacter canadensis MIT 98-5491]STP02521.1 stationary phase survival protein SurE [Helicobacter canadensis]